MGKKLNKGLDEVISDNLKANIGDFAATHNIGLVPLSRACGLGENTIINFMNKAGRTLSLTNAVMVASRLNVTVDDLIRRQTPQNVESVRNYLKLKGMTSYLEDAVLRDEAGTVTVKADVDSDLNTYTVSGLTLEQVEHALTGERVCTYSEPTASKNKRIKRKVRICQLCGHEHFGATAPKFCPDCGARVANR